MRFSRGFTIVEMLVTVVVLGIVMAFAAPSFNNLMRSVQIDGDLASIRTALSYARGEAVNTSEFVTICSSTNTEEVNPTCNGNRDWSQGWIVFQDFDEDRAFDIGTDNLLRIWEGTSQGALLEEQNNRSATTFDEQGQTDLALQLNLFYEVADTCGEEEARRIQVTASGRLDIAIEDCP